MAQTKAGALKIAAHKVGISVEEYEAKLAHNLKWCFACKQWQPRSSFNKDAHRGDGLTARCHDCLRVKEPKSRAGQPSPFKGRRHSEETKQLLREQKQGKPGKATGPRSPEARARIKAARRIHAVRGDKHHAWKGGIKPLNSTIRHSAEYADWRTAVFARDGYTCQCCGDKQGGNLNAHHIKDFANHPELRLDVANGVTLCEPCHDAVHTGAPRIRVK